MGGRRLINISRKLTRIGTYPEWPPRSCQIIRRGSRFLRPPLLGAPL